MKQVLKRLLQVLLGAAMLAMAATPAAAQFKSEGYEFLEAVKKRDGTKVTEMLDEPGNVLINTRDISNGETALHIAAQRRDTAWVKFLLQRGANPNIESREGVTPLEISSQLGEVDAVEALLKAGAQVDPTNVAGETPLIAAVHRSDIPMIRLLISKGANPDRSDNSGRTARDYAQLMGSRSQVLDEIDQAVKDKAAQAPTYGPN